MFDMVLKSMLPPGVTIESLTEQAQVVVGKMLQLAQDVAAMQAALQSVQAVQAEQSAMLRQIVDASQAIRPEIVPGGHTTPLENNNDPTATTRYPAPPDEPSA